MGRQLLRSPKGCVCLFGDCVLAETKLPADHSLTDLKGDMKIKRNAATVGTILLLSLVAVFYRKSHEGRQDSVKDVQDITKETNQKSRSCNEDIDWSAISADQMSPEQMFQYLHWTNRKACDFVQDFGGAVFTYLYKSIDGQKAICMDLDVKPSANCLVYSFGINNEWSFDKMLEALGCKIFAFDPSMARNDSDYTPNIHFFKMGLSHQDSDPSPGGWKMRTLNSIYQMLEAKHGDRVIDYLKIDVEGAEWKSVEQMLKTNIFDKVKQLGMEVHFSSRTKDDYQNGIRILKALEDYGMVRFSSRVNVYMNATIDFLGRTDYFGYEIAWYNRKFKSVPVKQ